MVWFFYNLFKFSTFITWEFLTLETIKLQKKRQKPVDIVQVPVFLNFYSILYIYNSLILKSCVFIFENTRVAKNMQKCRINAQNYRLECSFTFLPNSILFFHPKWSKTWNFKDSIFINTWVAKKCAKKVGASANFLWLPTSFHYVY